MAQHIKSILPDLVPGLLHQPQEEQADQHISSTQQEVFSPEIASHPALPNYTPSHSAETLVLRDVLIKTSGAIAIEVEIPLTARQLWNILIAAAYNNLGIVRTHRLPLKLVFQKLNMENHSYIRLREQLTSLLDAYVQQWNIFKKDKRMWSGTKLLAAATIDEATGEVKYEFSTELEQLLKVNVAEKTPYTKLSLKTQSLFSSKYAQILYEYLTDAHDTDRERSETAWITVQEYQAMMGKRYERWEIVRQRLVEEPLEQVQPILPFIVSWKTQRLTRKTSHIKFLFTRRTTEELQQLATGNLGEIPVPQKDYEAVFATFSPEEQEIIYNATLALMPAFIREEYLQYKPLALGIYQRILYPIWLGNRNTAIEQILLKTLPIEPYQLYVRSEIPK